MAKLIPTESDKQIMASAELARQAHNRFQAIYNQFLSMALPTRQRIGESRSLDNPRSAEEQDDIFDTTLQDAVADWASDCSDEFTPSYKPWTRHEVMGGLEQYSDAVKDEIVKIAKQRMATIYDRIRNSGFDEQSQGVYEELAMMPAGMDIPFTKAGMPLRFEHVPCSELLVLPAPYGGGPGDRFREREVQIKHVDHIWPKANWEHLGQKATRSKSSDTVKVIQAYTRDWNNRSEEVWTESLLCGGASVMPPVVKQGVGSCRLQIARPGVSAPTAYGVGSANRAIAPSRVLNELAYLELKRVGKVIDPPYIYSDDGTMNIEGGIDAGDWLEAGPDFNVESLAPQNDGREAWFKEEDLRQAVRRALYQDKPYQRGDTPPTAAQWLSEEQTNAKRKGFPRARIVQEFVLPILRRVEWILTERKEIEPIRMEGELIRLEPVSPMSRASDLEAVQMANQHMGLFADRFGEQVMDYYDLPDMMGKVAKRLGEEVIVIASEEEAMQKRSSRAQSEAAAGAMGQLAAGGGDVQS